ncbi:MAG: RnfABCDGE type electron transport complex subunit D [Clostridia bacterium]|nr:RnfABCDGE type electron transport complex subunit D [Clostridia bacterium]
MNKLTVSSSPHFRSPRTTRGIMLDVLIALLPALIAGSVIFGLRALLVAAVCVGSALLAEFLFNLICKKPNTLGDLTAAVTGLILALNIQVNVPLWQCAVGSVFAVIVVKCLFGGVGSNFANPAVTARIFMLLCFTGTVGAAAAPIISPVGEKVLIGTSATGATVDVVTGATPLELLKWDGALPSLSDMLLGIYGGAIGETCTVAILIGFIYLVARRVIHFETPLIFVGTVFVLALITEGSATLALYQILSGGLMFGAVFMATDYVTTPITRTGKMIFALGAGVITFLIRYFGAYPEGVSYAILLMNILSPYIEKWTAPRALGGAK